MQTCFEEKLRGVIKGLKVGGKEVYYKGSWSRQNPTFRANAIHRILKQR